MCVKVVAACRQGGLVDRALAIVWTNVSPHDILEAVLIGCGRIVPVTAPQQVGVRRFWECELHGFSAVDTAVPNHREADPFRGKVL